jgi:hypothetical protein
MGKRLQTSRNRKPSKRNKKNNGNDKMIPKYRKSFYGYDAYGFQETRKTDKDGFTWHT